LPTDCDPTASYLSLSWKKEIERMNTARLARKRTESAGNYAQMAEALGEEIDDPAAGLLTRDYLDLRLAELDRQIAEFEARFT
jgi:hypothetical protein